MDDQEKPVILLVDDTETNIDVLLDILSDFYEVSVALDGESALEIALEDQPDIILLDVMMPGMDGYEVCRRLKRQKETAEIPIVFVTARNEVADEAKGFDLGAVDYITKPVSPAIVKARVKTHVQLKMAQKAIQNQNHVLEERVQQRTVELRETQLDIIRKLCRAAEFRDNETGLHVIRMSHYSRIIGVAHGMKDADATLLLNASPMHDVGKIGIPDHVLLKPGKLTKEEFDVIKTHPEIGTQIIGDDPSPLLQMAYQIAYTHHEKWNGRGYPQGLKGADIPLVGRISAIADVFDALTTKRPYKEAWPTEKAIDLIQKERGEHFDPDLVQAFMKSTDAILDVKERFGEA